MKKLISLIFVMLLVCSFAMAENAFVTISNGQGELVMAYKKLEIADANSDGAITIYDALVAAHNAGYEGGAEAGFASSDPGNGMSIEMLWGEANGGSYGYYVNNTSAYSLLDPIAEGDHVQAYVYTDLETWSDTFSHFMPLAIETTANFEITLFSQGYDANWNSVLSPVAGAMITINGEDSGILTDAEGKAIMDINESGEYLISARSDSIVLVPPVCIATIK